MAITWSNRFHFLIAGSEYRTHSTVNEKIMQTLPRPLFVFAFLVAMVRISFGGEVLLHSGPMVSTPVSSLASRDKDGEELNFLKQFFIGSEELEILPSSASENESAPISAIRAIELATQSVDMGGRRSFNVKRMELLVSATAPKSINYYLVEMQVNGSTEHRVVLMDGSVIKPRLKRVGK